MTILNKYSRGQFYLTETLNGEEVRQPLVFDFNDFYRESLKNTSLIYTVTDIDAGRPDLIANTVYNNVYMYWVVCLANNIIYPNTELVSGTVLKLPSIQWIEQYVQRKVSQTRSSLTNVEL